MARKIRPGNVATTGTMPTANTTGDRGIGNVRSSVNNVLQSAANGAKAGVKNLAGMATDTIGRAATKKSTTANMVPGLQRATNQIRANKTVQGYPTSKSGSGSAGVANYSGGRASSSQKQNASKAVSSAKPAASAKKTSSTGQIKGKKKGR